ncbi:MAG: O-antigen ligase family protein [bacterium]
MEVKSIKFNTAIENKAWALFLAAPIAALVGVLSAISPAYVLVFVGFATAAILIAFFPEIAFAALFYIGVIKSNESIVAAVPFDLTLATFLIAAYILTTRFLVKKRREFPIDLFLMLALLQVAYLLISANFISPDTGSAMRNTMRFAVFNLFFLWGMLLLAGEPVRIYRTIVAVMIIGILQVLTFYTNLAFFREKLFIRTVWRATATAIGEDYIGFGLIASQTALFLLAIGFTEKTKIKKIIYITIGIIVSPAIIASASRGAVFSFIVGMITLLYCFNRFKLKKEMRQFIVVLTIIIAISISIFGFLIAMKLGVSRILFIHGTKTIFSRIEKMHLALMIFSAHPIFGAGVASFKPLTEQAYPHNIILEILCELGMVGFILFALQALLLLGFIKRIFSLPQMPNLYGILSLVGLVVFFTDSLFSGDISANREIWFYAGAIYALHHSYSKHDLRKAH